jgi:hypothetical protein
MKRSVTALLAICAFLIAGSAYASTTIRFSTPLALPTSLQMVVSVINTCSGVATYTVTIRTAANGVVLQTSSGQMNPDRGATIVYRSASLARSLVYAQINVTCSGEAPESLLSVVLANATSGVPVIAAEVPIPLT